MKKIILFLMMMTACSAFAQGQRENEAPTVSLHEAILMNNLKAVEKHIDAGSDLNALDAYGSTPLTVAVTFGMADGARILIDAGADPDKPNGEGSTPLHLAAFFCREEILDMLLDGGADREVANGAGLKPVDMVAAPFSQARPIYDGILESLSPLGLTLDYAHLEETRPLIQGRLGQ